MSWDPDIDDPTTRRHPYTEGGDDGMSTESRPGMPDLLAPIDPDAPVSGHVPPQEGKPIAQAPEHDWSAAQAGLYPLLRPVGTLGTHLDSIERATLAQHADQKHTTPLIDDGPQGTVVVYAIASSGFDVIANGDHVLAWGVPPAAVREAAYRNLSAWSAETGWVDETDGDRRLGSSATGGWGASRILLAGAGASLALACDIRVAAEDASFRLAFGRIGLIPDSGVTWILPRLVGPARAAALMLLDEPLSAADAERLGLVWKVVPPDRLLAEALATAARLATFAPKALALTKRAIGRSLEVGLDE